MANSFPIDPHLTSIAIAYKNPDRALIADRVLVRVPVGKLLFQWTSFNDLTTGYRLPETKVGPTGKLNRLELKGQRLSGRCEDDGISVPLSFYDTDDQGEGVKPEEMATEAAMNVVLLRHEVDTAALVFDADSYPTGNKETLSGTDQLSDYTNSDPLGVIGDALESMLMRGNQLVFGSAGWRIFRAHPKVVSAILGNSGTVGFVTREQVAALFEVKEVLVGEGWIDTSKPGETPAMARVWGKDIACLYRDEAAARAQGMTFGCTFTYGQRVAGKIPDPEMGLRGGQLVKAGESTKRLVVASSAGYFIEDAFA